MSGKSWKNPAKKASSEMPSVRGGDGRGWGWEECDIDVFSGFSVGHVSLSNKVNVVPRVRQEFPNYEFSNGSCIPPAIAAAVSPI